jgi:hypothetical protein
MESWGEKGALARDGKDNGRRDFDTHDVGGELEEATLVICVKGGREGG